MKGHIAKIDGKAEKIEGKLKEYVGNLFKRVDVWPQKLTRDLKDSKIKDYERIYSQKESEIQREKLLDTLMDDNIWDDGHFERRKRAAHCYNLLHRTVFDPNC